MKTTIQIYAGTYGKYSSGSLSGEWFDLSDYSDFDELMAAIKEYHSDESDPELMYQDIECPHIFRSAGLISESHISPDIYDAIESVENASYDMEVYEAYAKHIGTFTDIESLISDAEEAYCGEYGSDEEFSEQMAEDLGYLDEKISRWPYNCIDWEYAARELMYDYFESDGYYFRSL